MTQFEFVEVPISSRTKWRNIGLWLALSVFVGLFIVGGFSASGDDEHNGRVLAYCCIVALAYTLARAVKAILQKTERQLTKNGLIERQASRERERIRKQKFQWGVRRQIELWAKVLMMVAMIIVAVIWLWRPISDGFGSRVTVYPEHCEQSDSFGNCRENGWRVDPPTTYTIHVDQQFVVGIADDESAPHKLYNCVIADNRHWTCTQGPRKYSDDLTMNGGDFSTAEGQRYVSRRTWLLDKLTEP